MLKSELVSVFGGEPLSALTAADFLRIHFQDRLEPFGVGDRFVGLSQRPPGPIQRFTNHDGRRFARQTVVNPTFLLARGNQSALMKDGKVLGHGGGRQSQQFGDLANTQFAPAQCQKNPDAARIGQRLCDGHKPAHIYISPHNEMTIAHRTGVRNRFLKDFFQCLHDRCHAAFAGLALETVFLEAPLSAWRVQVAALQQHAAEARAVL
jgi:hypothetical protein